MRTGAGGALISVWVSDGSLGVGSVVVGVRVFEVEFEVFTSTLWWR